jgi:hypothetical protein
LEGTRKTKTELDETAWICLDLSDISHWYSLFNHGDPWEVAGMDRGPRLDHVDRYILARLNIFDSEKRSRVVHELEGEPQVVEVELWPFSDPNSGIFIRIDIEQHYDNDGNEICEKAFFKMLLDENLAKSLANAFGVACEMTGDPYEGWGVFGVSKYDIGHDAAGESLTIDIKKDYSGLTIEFYLIDETEGSTSQNYVSLRIPHDFGRCLGHLIAAAYVMPRLETNYRGEYPGVKRTRELTFSTSITHTLRSDEPQE